MKVILAGLTNGEIVVFKRDEEFKQFIELFPSDIVQGARVTVVKDSKSLELITKKVAVKLNDFKRKHEEKQQAAPETKV